MYESIRRQIKATSMIKHGVISVGYGRHMFKSDNAERVRMELCAKETASFDMVIFTMKSDGLKTENNGLLTIHPTNSRFKLLMLFDAFLLGRRIIRTNKQSSIITTQDPFAAGLVGWLLAKLHRLQLVVQEHGDVFGAPYWRQESYGNQVWFKIGGFILKQANVVRVVARRVGEHVQTVGVVSEKITHLPVAIDLTQFKNVPKVKKDEETFTFITVARLVPQKNLVMLLQAFKTAWQNNPHTRLLIVGRGQLQKELQNLISQQYKNIDADNVPVVMEDWSDDVPALFAQADAYVLSSDYEGWGRVLIEALVMGLPIVTTDVGCADEVIKHEQHGLIVPTRDEQALQSAIERLVTDTALQKTINNNLSELDPWSIPGTDLDSYGKQWVESLKVT